MNRSLNEEQLRYYKDDDKKKNIIIALLIVVVILLSIMCIYFMFFNKKNDEKVVEDNNKIVEKELTNEEKIEIINLQIKEFPYTKIITDNISHDELFTSVAINKALYEIKGNDPSNSDWTDISDEVETIKKLAEALGLTKNEVSKIDIELWKKIYGGSTSYTIYNKTDVVDAVKKIYKNYKYNLNLNESKYMNLNGSDIIYDKNIDKLIYHQGGVTYNSTISPVIVLDTSFENNVYKMNFIKTIYKFSSDDMEGDYCYVVDTNGEHNNIDCFSTSSEPVGSGETLEKMATDYAMSHKDDLPQYEISFKIDGNSYEFVEIKKLN